VIAHYYVQEMNAAPVALWPQALDFALPRADTVEFVVDRAQKRWPDTLKPFSALLSETFASRWRWQVRQLGSTTFARFPLTAEMAAYLRSLPKVDCWLANYPEDPALYSEGIATLWTTSHEQLVFLWLTQEEAITLNAAGFTLNRTGNDLPPTRRPLTR